MKLWQLLFWKLLGNLKPLIGPSDVGGQCPSPTFPYGSGKYCCCANGCCWSGCTFTEPPADCLQNVPNSYWIYSQDLGVYQAMQGTGKIEIVF